MDLELGSWAAAYLVLVGGVAQQVLGAGTAWLASRPPTRRKASTELAVWNLGVAAVLGGTISGVPAVSTLGGLALVLTCGWLGTTSHSASIRSSRWPLLLWWGTWLVVVSSIPVGVVLAWTRHG